MMLLISSLDWALFHTYLLSSWWLYWVAVWLHW